MSRGVGPGAGTPPGASGGAPSNGTALPPATPPPDRSSARTVTSAARRRATLLLRAAASGSRGPAGPAAPARGDAALLPAGHPAWHSLALPLPLPLRRERRRGASPLLAAALPAPPRRGAVPPGAGRAGEGGWCVAGAAVSGTGVGQSSLREKRSVPWQPARLPRETPAAPASPKQRARCWGLCNRGGPGLGTEAQAHPRAAGRRRPAWPGRLLPALCLRCAGSRSFRLGLKRGGGKKTLKIWFDNLSVVTQVHVGL